MNRFYGHSSIHPVEPIDSISTGLTFLLINHDFMRDSFLILAHFRKDKKINGSFTGKQFSQKITQKKNIYANLCYYRDKQMLLYDKCVLLCPYCNTHMFILFEESVSIETCSPHELYFITHNINLLISLHL